MKATVFDLGGGIGVCYFERGGSIHVAEVSTASMRVLPQSVRVAVAVQTVEVELDEEATEQDRVDRMALAIARLRGRVAEFDFSLVSRADPRELEEQVRALSSEVSPLDGRSSQK